MRKEREDREKEKAGKVRKEERVWKRMIREERAVREKREEERVRREKGREKKR
ncbi:MAG: hypothetical protein LBH46_02835 [Rickettsiales bacterium]|nr:hypothetical protein [Rickettsiales bacterium]